MQVPLLETSRASEAVKLTQRTVASIGEANHARTRTLADPEAKRKANKSVSARLRLLGHPFNNRAPSCCDH